MTAINLAKCKEISLNLQAKTLSDKISIKTYDPLALQGILSGSIGDFNFNAYVEDYSLDEKTGLYSCNAFPDIEKTMYTSVFMENLTDSVSTNILTQLISSLGKSANIRIDSHSAPANLNDTPVTYRDIMSLLFGWTSEVPTMQVNAFLRGNTVNVIQRGHEASTYTLQSTGYANVTRKYLRTMLSGATGSITAAISGKPAPKFNHANYYTGTKVYGDNTVTFTNGLTTRETHTEGGVITTTDYTYTPAYPPAHMTSKTVTKGTTDKAVTTYSYTGDVLTTQTEEFYTSKNGSDWTLNKTRVTRYAPAGQGYFNVSVEEDGVTVSNALQKGNPGNYASPFQLEQFEKDQNSSNDRPTVNLSGFYVGGGSFNVTDQTTLNKIAAAIEWLNGKTEERVTVRAFDSHIVDFTERPVWGGNEYFLENNRAVKDSRRTYQDLELVRWY